MATRKPEVGHTDLTLRVEDGTNNVELFHGTASLGTAKHCAKTETWKVRTSAGSDYVYSERDTAVGALTSFALMYLAGVRAAG